MDTSLSKAPRSSRRRERQAPSPMPPPSSESINSTNPSTPPTENFDPETCTSSPTDPNNSWNTGDYCQARFSEDGQLYEGTIMSLHSERSEATVRYVGYNNEEEISTHFLLKSKGQESRLKQEELADDDQLEQSGSTMSLGASLNEVEDDSPLPATRKALSPKDMEIPPCKYEYLDHPADVQLHSWGANITEAFEQAAVAMYGYMTEINKVEILDQQEIEASADDMEGLLFHFLDECLYIFCVEPYFIGSKVVITEFDKERFCIKATVFGEEFDLEKHPQGTEVKAITYASMQVYDKDDQHELFVILDI